MMDLLNIKWHMVTAPEALVDGASLTTTEIDTQGFNECVIAVYVGTTDIAFTALKVQHSDTSGSGFTDIDNADFDGDIAIDGVASVLPSATDDDNFLLCHLDLRGKKRYLDLVATIGDGTAGAWVYAIAILGRPDIGLQTEAEMGAETVLAA